MNNSSLLALAAALIGLSGCVAYPAEGYPPGGDRGARQDRDRDHDQRDDRNDDNRDRRGDCDPRVSDCTHR